MCLSQVETWDFRMLNPHDMMVKSCLKQLASGKQFARQNHGRRVPLTHTHTHVIPRWRLTPQSITTQLQSQGGKKQ